MRCDFAVKGVEFVEEAIKTSNGAELKKKHNLSHNALRRMDGKYCVYRSWKAQKE